MFFGSFDFREVSTGLRAVKLPRWPGSRIDDQIERNLIKHRRNRVSAREIKHSTRLRYDGLRLAERVQQRAADLTGDARTSRLLLSREPFNPRDSKVCRRAAF